MKHLRLAIVYSTVLHSGQWLNKPRLRAEEDLDKLGVAVVTVGGRLSKNKDVCKGKKKRQENIYCMGEEEEEALFRDGIARI